MRHHPYPAAECRRHGQGLGTQDLGAVVQRLSVEHPLVRIGARPGRAAFPQCTSVRFQGAGHQRFGRNSTDPDLADYIHRTPSLPEFLRAAQEMELTSEDFEVLLRQLRRGRPSDTFRAEEE